MRAQSGGDHSVAAVRPFGPEGRQMAITELVLRHGTVSARELATTFDVSVMTIHRDLDELLRDLAQRLPHIVPFDYINVVLHDPAREVMRLWLLVASAPSTISPGLETPVDQSPGGLVWKTQQPLIVNDRLESAMKPPLANCGPAVQ